MKWIRVLNLTPITDTFFIVDGLHRDIDYEFRVAAENRAGCGPYSEVFGPVKTYVHKGQSSISVIPRALHILCCPHPERSFHNYHGFAYFLRPLSLLG